ncbi:hypothetical protein B5X24_HaOG209452 [Helicoverpa armigera]|uniref:Uncharacterized protein n=1 Tax=Helicoverpa armigera TaxID=29058 RepID=A0A2W1BLB7_HELAM|nr:hypothetical protein B5X24_HaOG209452 [Helicoverpa armigera]
MPSDTYLSGVHIPVVQHGDKFVAGAAAGVTAVTLTYPLDTIRARLAFQITGEHKYTGIAHAATTMFKTEGGIRALYRGFVPTMMGMVPYAGFSFYCFEYLKFICMKYVPTTLCRKCDRNTAEPRQTRAASTRKHNTTRLDSNTSASNASSAHKELLATDSGAPRATSLQIKLMTTTTCLNRAHNHALA